MGKESQLLEAAAAGNNSKVEVSPLTTCVCAMKSRRRRSIPGVYRRSYCVAVQDSERELLLLFVVALSLMHAKPVGLC